MCSCTPGPSKTTAWYTIRSAACTAPNLTFRATSWNPCKKSFWSGFHCPPAHFLSFTEPPGTHGLINCEAVLWIRIRIGAWLDPDSMGSLDPDSQSGSGTWRAKNSQKNRKWWINFIFWRSGCSLLRSEGFFCRLYVLYKGVSKMQFL